MWQWGCCRVGRGTELELLQGLLGALTAVAAPPAPPLAPHETTPTLLLDRWAGRLVRPVVRANALDVHAAVGGARGHACSHTAPHRRGAVARGRRMHGGAALPWRPRWPCRPQQPHKPVRHAPGSARSARSSPPRLQAAASGEAPCLPGAPRMRRCRRRACDARGGGLPLQQAAAGPPTCAQLAGYWLGKHAGAVVGGASGGQLPGWTHPALRRRRRHGQSAAALGRPLHARSAARPGPAGRGGVAVTIAHAVAAPRAPRWLSGRVIAR